MTDGSVEDRFSHLTDKFAHGYWPVYERLAAETGPAGHVLEVGVYKGGSLRLWQELFPDGLVAGVDNNSAAPATWPPGTRQIIADQTDISLRQLARDISPDGYDLIIDDASHSGEASGITFRTLWQLVKPGRYYALEDWDVAFTMADSFGASMLRLAESFLALLVPGEGADEIVYRFGLAVIRKSRDGS